MENAETSKNPAYYGKFEHQSHGQGEGTECGDVAREGDAIRDVRTHLVSAEETESKGEKNKIADGNADDEHPATKAGSAARRSWL